MEYTGVMGKPVLICQFFWLTKQQKKHPLKTLFSILWRERKPTRCNNQMFIINLCLNMFWASLCPSSGEQRPCVTAYGVLRWFCWMWLVVVVGCCVVGCEHCEGYCPTVTFTVLASYYHYQPHPAEPAQYTICSNTVFVLLNMGILMPQTCWDRSW